MVMTDDYLIESMEENIKQESVSETRCKWHERISNIE